MCAGRPALTGPTRPDEQDRRIGQSAQREAERARRRRVEPLEVVDRNDQQLVLRERLQGAADGDAERACVGRAAGRLLEQERDLERAPSRRSKERQNVVEGVVEEVAESGVGEPVL